MRKIAAISFVLLLWCSAAIAAMPERFGTYPPPPFSFPSGITGAVVYLQTTGNATCKYSTTPGVPYSSMTGTFSTTGANLHLNMMMGLSDNMWFNYYVRCTDGGGNTNPDDYIITIGVGFNFSIGMGFPSGGMAIQ
jgi:hypothetical protein